MLVASCWNMGNSVSYQKWPEQTHSVDIVLTADEPNVEEFLANESTMSDSTMDESKTGECQDDVLSFGNPLPDICNWEKLERKDGLIDPIILEFYKDYFLFVQEISELSKVLIDFYEADLDSDGNIDRIVITSGPGKYGSAGFYVDVLRNNGDGSFIEIGHAILPTQPFQPFVEIMDEFFLSDVATDGYYSIMLKGGEEIYAEIRYTEGRYRGFLSEYGKRPVDQPGTTWVSSSPYIWFKVPESRTANLYGQIELSGEIIDVIISFSRIGNMSVNTSPAIATENEIFFGDPCEFGEGVLIVHVGKDERIYQHPQYRLDDAIEKIVFYRLDN